VSLYDSQWFGEPHTLTVRKVTPPASQFDDGELEYDLEHLPSCTQEVSGEGGRSHTYYTYYTCDVGWLEGDIGLASALNYSGTPITEPGTYRIQGWGTKSYHWEYGYEYDAGIAVMEPRAGGQRCHLSRGPAAWTTTPPTDAPATTSSTPTTRRAGTAGGTCANARTTSRRIGQRLRRVAGER
jgi:hypothetical protein